MSTPQSAGGKASGIIQRQRALDNYYANPNFCLFCYSIILVPDKAKITSIKTKKFCNSSCAASFNNSISPKRKAINSGNCIKCNILFSFKKKGEGGYDHRSYCDDCLILQKSYQITNTTLTIDDLFENQTKGSLRARKQDCKSFHSAIRTHSRQLYINTGLPMQCKICGYDKYVEVAHIKSVKDFSNDAKVLEINSIDNLMALCPTHHWEFDNGILI